MAAHVEHLRGVYPFSRIVADTGGFGKGYAEEMKSRFSIPVFAAQKRQKASFIEHMNGDFRSGNIQICRDKNSDLIEEVGLLQWNLDAMERGKMMVDDRRFQDHLSDALLYAWRECRHHGEDFEYEGPTFGTRAYWEAEADRMEQEEVDRLDGDSETPWWASV